MENFCYFFHGLHTVVPAREREKKRERAMIGRISYVCTKALIVYTCSILHPFRHVSEIKVVRGWFVWHSWPTAVVNTPVLTLLFFGLLASKQSLKQSPHGRERGGMGILVVAGFGETC